MACASLLLSTLLILSSEAAYVAKTMEKLTLVKTSFNLGEENFTEFG